MKTVKERFAIIDENGLGVIGKEVWFYPIGTTAHGTKASEVTGKPGQYDIEIDPAADNNVISYYYDIWYDGAKQEPKVALSAKWFWFCNLIVNISPKTVAFADLLDEYGLALPTTIPKAEIQIMFSEKGRGFFLTASSDTDFTMQATDYRDDDTGDLPINVHLKIVVSEA